MQLTSAALGLLLLTSQPGLSGALASSKSAGAGAETAGTAAAILSFQITEEDLAAQLSRVYRLLTSEQVELDAEASRILSQNLWSLY